MRLYLARHGEAVGSHIEPDSPLSETGQRDTRMLAAFLAENFIRVGQFRHSGKTRARQTAELLAKAMGAEPVSLEIMEGINPNDSPEPMLAMIETWSQDTLVVGHLPFMGRLIDLILGGAHTYGVAEFTTSTVVCLQKMGPGRWTIRWMVNPELLLGRS